MRHRSAAECRRGKAAAWRVTRELRGGRRRIITRRRLHARPVPASRVDGVLLAGDLATPGTVSFAELRSLPQHHRRGVIRYACTGPREYDFDGLSLLDVANWGRPTFDPDVRKEGTRTVPDRGARPGRTPRGVLLGGAGPGLRRQPRPVGRALRRAPAGGAGPQVVVPIDGAGGRHVSGVTRLWIGFPRETTDQPAWEPTVMANAALRPTTSSRRAAAPLTARRGRV
jgi:hypothetical protein